MTGFGRAEGVVKDRKVTVEVRSLNSKQLDLLVKLPAVYREKEAEVRQLAGELMVRGKAEVIVHHEQGSDTRRTTFDRELVQAYYTELREIAEAVAPGTDTDLLAQVLRMPDVMTTRTEVLEGAEWEALLALVRQALAAYDGFRLNEGARLLDELVGRVKRIEQLLLEAESMDTDRSDRTRERLRAKLADLQVNVDQDRFEQELVYYLEKLDITEEKVRLRAHCTYFQETMAGDEQQGRKLNFIAQEMGREINTLGSKANDAAIQRVVVLMKDELEKVKEQVLNVL
ncbi:MAG: YicC family protein [Flavobacteriales bacterium]|nr:YicC family protein [Flavobacteriales bacterium]